MMLDDVRLESYIVGMKLVRALAAVTKLSDAPDGLTNEVLDGSLSCAREDIQSALKRIEDLMLSIDYDRKDDKASRG